MKTVARICICLSCLALLLAVGYVISSRLSLSGKISAQPAINDEGGFEEIKAQVEKGEYAGITALEGAEKYHLITVRVNIKSYSPFKAEWISLRVESADGAWIVGKDTPLRPGDAPVSLEGGDLLLTEKNAWIRQIDSFGTLGDEGGLYVKLLSSNRDPALRAYLEYYIFGRYHSLEIPLIG